MAKLLTLEKYSLGIGDRFGQQGKAQLRACMLAAEQGITVVPVWNKSNREHQIIGSDPAATRAEAEAAVKMLGWKKPFHVDADHIRLETVERFLPYSDFFTIDVADFIGRPAQSRDVESFLGRHPELARPLPISGLEKPLHIAADEARRITGKYLEAVRASGALYRHIAKAKGEGNFITEVSMDETDSPQTAPELLVILAALADEAVPVQTIAPKFSGRFNKGVDYIGDRAQFEREFAADLAVIAFAVNQYRLPPALKLSVHSGSDKFSLYSPMARSLLRFNAGLHLKTAGTTWLEELIGLAEAGGEGLALAKEIYAEALQRIEELRAPYASVIDIRPEKLPSASEVNRWNSEQFVAALRHDQKHPAFNSDLRQLLHVAYKLAAQRGARYLDALAAHESTVARNVTENLFERHLKPLFLSARS